jgi:hypothetical protein
MLGLLFRDIKVPDESILLSTIVLCVESDHYLIVWLEIVLCRRILYIGEASYPRIVRKNLITETDPFYDSGHSHP